MAGFQKQLTVEVYQKHPQIFDEFEGLVDQQIKEKELQEQLVAEMLQILALLNQSIEKFLSQD